MRLATLAIAIFSLVAGDHIIQPQSALGKSAAAASSRGVAITPDGAFVYVTIAGPDTVADISTPTNMVVETIAVGPDIPVAVSITPIA